MKLISIKSQASPILLSGAGEVIGQSGVGFFIQPFGEFEKVTDIVAGWDGGAISGYLTFMKPTIVSGNAVLVATQKLAFYSGLCFASAYLVTLSGDLIGNTFTIIAQGE